MAWNRIAALVCLALALVSFILSFAISVTWLILVAAVFALLTIVFWRIGKDVGDKADTEDIS